MAVALATASLISPYFAAVFFAPAAFICGVIALARGEKKWIGIAGLVLALVAFVGIFGVSQEITQVFSSGTLPRSALDAAPIVSKSKYDQIHEGMTYEQVKTIIGSPGEEVSRTDLSGTSTVIYSWSNSNGSNLIATFEDDRLASKAQFGLSE